MKDLLEELDALAAKAAREQWPRTEHYNYYVGTLAKYYPALARELRAARALAFDYSEARTDLLAEPLLHGDADHREWLVRELTARFQKVDASLSAYRRARQGEGGEESP